MADRSAAVRSVSSSTLFAEIDVGMATTYAAAGDAAVTKARPRIAASRVFMPPSSLSSTALLLLMRRRDRPTFRRGGGRASGEHDFDMPMATAAAQFRH